MSAYWRNPNAESPKIIESQASDQTSETERAFRELTVAMYKGGPALHKDYFARDIYLTMCNGAYGPAWIVISLQGSPPRGTFVVPVDHSDCPIYWFDRSHVRRIPRTKYSRKQFPEGTTDRRWIVIMRFLAEQGFLKATP